MHGSEFWAEWTAEDEATPYKRQSAILTRGEALAAISDPRAFWSIAEAPERLAGLSADRVAAFSEFFEPDPAELEALDNAQRIRKELSRQIETKENGQDVGRVAARLMGCYSTITKSAAGNGVQITSGSFSLLAFLRLACECLIWQRMDIPAFHLFHDLEAEARHEFEAGDFLPVLEPIPLDFALNLRDIERDVFNKYKFLSVEPYGEISQDEYRSWFYETEQAAETGSPDACQTPTIQRSGGAEKEQLTPSAALPDAESRRPIEDTQGASQPADAAQQQTAGGIRRKRLEEIPERMLAVADALDICKDRQTQRGYKKALYREIADRWEVRRKHLDAKDPANKPIDPDTARKEWLPRFEGLPAEQREQLRRRALGLPETGE